jgi:pimeloyl-ACP methyl ester carboxylesterase
MMKVISKNGTHTLQVPGASLYYEVRGSGPTLLMMPGGPADAESFRAIAEQLAPHFTVVTYDPRGLSHSKLEGPLDGDRIVEIFADDAHRLLAAVTIQTAFVFGSSGGAVFALELAARHPEQLATVVAHEPPAPALLPDTARRRAEMVDIVETFRTTGLGPTMQKFMAHTGIRGGPPPEPQGEPTLEMREAMANMQRNMDFWFGSGYFGSIAAYEPDFETLKGAMVRIVSAVVRNQAASWPTRAVWGSPSDWVAKRWCFPAPTAATAPTRRNSQPSCEKCSRTERPDVMAGQPAGISRFTSSFLMNAR